MRIRFQSTYIFQRQINNICTDIFGKVNQAAADKVREMACSKSKIDLVDALPKYLRKL